MCKITHVVLMSQSSDISAIKCMDDLRLMLRAFRKKRNDPRAEAKSQSYLSCVRIESHVLSIDVIELGCAHCVMTDAS